MTIGLDMSKDKIDACRWLIQEFKQFDNNAIEITKNSSAGLGTMLNVSCLNQWQLASATGKGSCLSTIAFYQNQSQTGSLFCQSLWQIGQDQKDQCRYADANGCASVTWKARTASACHAEFEGTGLCQKKRGQRQSHFQKPPPQNIRKVPLNATTKPH